jgi:hypothetical protein
MQWIKSYFTSTPINISKPTGKVEEDLPEGELLGCSPPASNFMVCNNILEEIPLGESSEESSPKELIDAINILNSVKEEIKTKELNRESLEKFKLAPNEGAKHPSSGGADLTLFKLTVKNVSITDLPSFLSILQKAFVDYPIDAITELLKLNDDRKEVDYLYRRNVFLKSIETLTKNPEDAQQFKTMMDFSMIDSEHLWSFLGTSLEDFAIKAFSDQLRLDFLYNTNKVCKYAPAEYSKLNKKYKIVGRIIRNLGITNKEYRVKVALLKNKF